MNIAIQEDMLPGPGLEERFQQAGELGFQGIEFWSLTLPQQAREIENLSGTNDVVASSVNHGRRARFLDPDPEERHRAEKELIEAIELAGGIGANGVVFVPHFFEPLLPDLSPYKTAYELEVGLLREQLMRFLEEADRHDVHLWVEPVNRYETSFLNTVGQAAEVIRPLKHQRAGVVADLFHMALDEDDIPQAIHDQKDSIRHVHLADSNRRLPGQGTTDFSAALDALQNMNYSGWMAYECGEPGENLRNAVGYLEELPESVAFIHTAWNERST